MTFDLLIRNGTLVTGSRVEAADIGVRDGKIAEIGSLGSSSAEETLDARGLHVFPGVIDTQVHFREPGLTHKEDLESGTRAAILGGVTTVFDEPNTSPTTTSAAALAEKLALAKGRAWCEYAFWVGASTQNLDQLAELDQLDGSPGIGEVFMGSSTGPLLVATDEELRLVLLNGRRRVSIHAEDEFRNVARRQAYDAGTMQPDPSLGYPLDGTAADHPHVRDAESARLATARILALAEETGRPIHILHMSTLDEIPLVESARGRGVDVTTEITPQHLWFAAPDCYAPERGRLARSAAGEAGETPALRHGSFTQMNPPIRSANHREALREAFRRGFFTVIGSDHAPHTRDEKAKPYPHSPSGIPGVQTLLPVMLTLAKQGLCDLETIARLTAENPASTFGVIGKGFLQPGFDADLVLLDPIAPFEVEEFWLASKCGWSPYSGETLFGQPRHTLIRAQIVMRDCVAKGSQSGIPVTFG